MAKISCFSAILAGKKKRSKDSPKTVDPEKMNSDLIIGVKPKEFVYPSDDKHKDEVSLEILTPVSTQKKSSVELVDDKNLVKVDSTVEAAYEGGDEQDDILSMKRDFSDIDLQAKAEGKGELNCHHSIECNYELNKDGMEIPSERDEGITPEVMIQSGHVSDPGTAQKTGLWESPSLMRSCSNIETKRASKLLDSPKKSHSHSFVDIQNLSGNAAKEAISRGIQDSPLSVKTSASADRIMLKKRSSSQVLPSRSRKLWWKLFLWSHRNLHNPWASKPQKVASANDGFEQKGGYTSDTLEASHQIDEKNKREMKEPQNQWVAFSAESSSLDRVNAWVNSLEDDYFCPNENEDDQNFDGEVAGAMLYPNSSEIGESSRKNHHQAGLLAADEVLQANRMIQSLNTLSSVAHISGMGLKVIPAISAFTSLRAINLSGNFIVHISTGLPKSLHTLDLSRNKIATIEGLKELTKLRILNLSYNRISRIGHGLSSCTAIKELYLAGNKISNVEGLHRLLKLTILDLSFNKITTANALGQLVANYNSLLALNLLGNPIQSNIGDDQLRKAVTGLLPHLTYLNKQPIKLHRAREVATDSVARAALGNDGWNFRRKSARRVGQGSISSIKSNTGEGRRGLGGGVVQKSSRHRSRGSQQTARK